MAANILERFAKAQSLGSKRGNAIDVLANSKKSDDRGVKVTKAVVIDVIPTKSAGTMKKQFRMLWLLEFPDNAQELQIPIFGYGNKGRSDKSKWVLHDSDVKYRTYPGMTILLSELNDDITVRKHCVPGTVVSIEGLKMQAFTSQNPATANDAYLRTSFVASKLGAISGVTLEDAIVSTNTDYVLFQSNPTHVDDMKAISDSIGKPMNPEDNNVPKRGVSFSLFPPAQASRIVDERIKANVPFAVGSINMDPPLISESHFMYMSKDQVANYLLRGTNTREGHEAQNLRPLAMAVAKQFGGNAMSIMVYTIFWDRCFEGFGFYPYNNWVLFGPTIVRGLCGQVVGVEKTEISADDETKGENVDALGKIAGFLISDVAGTVRNVGFKFSAKMFPTLVQTDANGNAPMLVVKPGDNPFNHEAQQRASKYAANVGTLSPESRCVSELKRGCEAGELELWVVVPARKEGAEQQVRAIEDENERYAALMNAEHPMYAGCVENVVPSMVYVTVTDNKKPISAYLRDTRQVVNEPAVKRLKAAAKPSA